MSDVVVRNELRRKIFWKWNGRLLVLLLVVGIPYGWFLMVRSSSHSTVLQFLVWLIPVILLSQAITLRALHHSPKSVVFENGSVTFRFRTRSLSLKWKEIESIGGSNPLRIKRKSGKTISLCDVDSKIVTVMLSNLMNRREVRF